MSAWTEHVTAALLGTRRRPVPPLTGAEPTAGDPPPASEPPFTIPGSHTDNPPPTEDRPGHTVTTPGSHAGDPPPTEDPRGHTLRPLTVPGSRTSGPPPAEDPRIADGSPATAGPPPAGDPAGRLLDQAALLTARRRAGRPPETAEPVAPAPAETTRPVPAAAARRLRRILAGEQARLLPEWLDAAARAGRHVPPSLLPELLDRGRADRALRPYLARATGRRGVWLAMRNVDWAYLVVTGGDEAAADPALWETGVRAQRVGHLTRLRAVDPAAARATLSSTWAREPAADRAAFLATFARGLSPADEEFLEAALDDRGVDVRRVAADLLARLSASTYGTRMAARGRSCLWPAGAGDRRRIVVDPPREHDDAMLRDGIPFHAAAGVGNRAGWLRETLGRAPLSTWTELFGAGPEQLVRLPIVTHRDAARLPADDPARTRPAPAGAAGPAAGANTLDAAGAPSATSSTAPAGASAAGAAGRPGPGSVPGAAGRSGPGHPPGRSGPGRPPGGAGRSGPDTADPGPPGRTAWAEPVADPRAREDVHQGWADAAVRQRDAAWARALLGTRVAAGDARTLAGLLDALPDDERDRAAAAAIRPIRERPDLLGVLQRLPGPWRGELADAVIEVLASVASRDEPGRVLIREMSAEPGAASAFSAQGTPSPAGTRPLTGPASAPGPAGTAGGAAEVARDRVLTLLCGPAGEHLAADTAPRLAGLARRHRDVPALAELAETLGFRHQMHDELR